MCCVGCCPSVFQLLGVVLDKVRNHKVEDVVKKIRFDFKNKTSGTLVVPAQLNRVNYPQNCYTVNLTEVDKARKEIVKTLWIDFKAEKTKEVTIHLQGRTLAAKRDVYDNKFYTKGDEMYVKKEN